MLQESGVMRITGRFWNVTGKWCDENYRTVVTWTEMK